MINNRFSYRTMYRVRKPSYSQVSFFDMSLIDKVKMLICKFSQAMHRRLRDSISFF